MSKVSLERTRCFKANGEKCCNRVLVCVCAYMCDGLLDWVLKETFLRDGFRMSLQGWTGSSGGENHRHTGLEASLIWIPGIAEAVSLHKGRGRWQRHEAESRSQGRDLEAEVSSLDFVSSAVGSLEWRQDLVDLHIFLKGSSEVCGGWVTGEEERWWNYLRYIYYGDLPECGSSLCFGAVWKSLHVSVSNFPSA